MEDQNKNLTENEISLEEREKRAREYSRGVAKRNLIRGLITIFAIIAAMGVLFAILHGVFKRKDIKVPERKNTPAPASIIIPAGIASAETEE